MFLLGQIQAVLVPAPPVEEVPADLVLVSGHTRPVTALLFSPDGKTLASSGGDGAVLLWDPRSGVETGRLAGHTGAVRAIAFSPDGRLLASASEDRTIRVWDAGARKLLRSLAGDAGPVTHLAFGPGGARLASAGTPCVCGTFRRANSCGCCPRGNMKSRLWHFRRTAARCGWPPSSEIWKSRAW